MFRTAGRGARRRLRVNAEYNPCNWLVPEGMESGFCLACRHNGTVPDLSVSGKRWHALEVAKHRLLYSLVRWHLPLGTRAEDPQHGLTLRFTQEVRDAPKAHLGKKWTLARRQYDARETRDFLAGHRTFDEIAK